MDNTALLVKSMADLASWMDTRMSEFENAQQSSSGHTVKTLSADYLMFKSTVMTTLNMLKIQLELVVNGLERLETHSRRKVLLFHGIPEESTEELPQKLQGILRGQMKLSSIDTQAIEVCHRLGVKKDKARPVLVRFSTATHRSAVWSAKTKLKGTKTSVSEFLTKSRQDIFTAARKHFGMKNSWSADGAIVVQLPDKSRKKLVTMSALQKLIEEHPLNNAAK
ncbi:hypothetical protein NE865_04215 [Phthorimaea operculella]|nr:hypothetical protein NE865_04215 [Phthorimaea operculella]